MSLTAPESNKQVLRIGRGAETSYLSHAASSTLTPGGIYITNDTHKMYIADTASSGFALNAEKADTWSAYRKFTIKSTADDNAANGVEVNGSAPVALLLPKTLSGFTTISATTFSGSLSGNATSASKLSAADKGSATIPVYFKNGVPVACSGTLGLNATSANKWVTPRTFTITDGGDTTYGSTSFDGSGNILLELTGLTANQTAQALKLQFGTGTTEGTNVYTFNGSAAKTVQVVTSGNYLSLSAAAGKITLSAGSALTDLKATVDSINNSYITTTNAKNYTDTAVNTLKGQILGDGNLVAAYDTLVEISQAMKADDDAMAALLTKVGNKVNADGTTDVTGTNASGTWDISVTGSAAKWTTARKFTIGATASSTASNGVEVNGTSSVNLLLPNVLDGFTSITSTNFVGNASSASKLSAADAGGKTIPVFFQNGVPVACSGTLGLNATSASKWSSSRTITFAGDVSGSVSFNGSQNVTTTELVVNATSAKKLEEAFTLTIGAVGAEIDGSENILFKAEDIGSTVVWETF